MPELGDTGSLPGFPSLAGHRRLSRHISFKNRDAVAIATQHDRCTQTDCAATADHDFAHLYPQVHLWLDANANLFCGTLQGTRSNVSVGSNAACRLPLAGGEVRFRQKTDLIPTANPVAHASRPL